MGKFKSVKYAHRASRLWLQPEEGLQAQDLPLQLIITLTPADLITVLEVIREGLSGLGKGCATPYPSENVLPIRVLL